MAAANCRMLHVPETRRYPAVLLRRSSDLRFQHYEAPALHVESCSPELLRLARRSASGGCGLSAGVLAAGPVSPSYLSAGLM